MNKLPRNFLAGAAAMLLLASQPLAAKTVKDIKMRFEVEDGALVLSNNRFYTTASNCKRNDHEGCYNFDENDLGKFRLNLKHGDADCDHADRWRFKDVVLGGESTMEEPLPKPETWGDVSDGLAKDFNANAETGRINFEQDGDRRIRFEDQNDYPASVWYKVVVESCTADSDGNRETLEYDPRIDNKGSPG